MATLYVDLDGVLADFDNAARAIIGEDTYKYEWLHGAKVFWDKLYSARPNLFETFFMMKSAGILLAALKGVPYEILTALPKSNEVHVDLQKRSWCRAHLGPDVKVNTCLTQDKPKFCKPGDILIDDRTVNKVAWEKAGGFFVWHEDAHYDRTIATLRTLKVI